MFSVVRPRCIYCWICRLSLMCTFKIVKRAMISVHSFSSTRKERKTVEVGKRESDLMRWIPIKWTTKQFTLYSLYCNSEKQKQRMISFFCHSTSRTFNWFIFIYNVVFTPYFFISNCASIVSLTSVSFLTFPNIQFVRTLPTLKCDGEMNSDSNIKICGFVQK